MHACMHVRMHACMHVCMYVHARANMAEVNPHARVDINNDIVVDMLNTERKSLR